MYSPVKHVIVKWRGGGGCFGDCNIKVQCICPLCLEPVRLDLSSQVPYRILLVPLRRWTPPGPSDDVLTFKKRRSSAASGLNLKAFMSRTGHAFVGSEALWAQQRRICMFCLQTFGENYSLTTFSFQLDPPVCWPSKEDSEFLLYP